MRRGLTRSVLVVLAIVCGLAAGAGAQEGPEDGEASGSDPTLELVDRSAWVAADGVLTLDVATEGDVADTTVRVRVRAALDDAADLAPALESPSSTIIHASPFTPVDDVPVLGGSTRRIEVGADALGAPGVHVVTVDLVARSGEILDTVATPVILLGDASEPLPVPRLALLADLGVATTVTPTERRSLTTDEVDRLTRLTALLDTDAEVTVLAVPDTLSALAESDQPEAATVLASVVEAAGRSTVLSHPSVTLSARAVVDADIADAIADAVTAGERVQRRLLAAPPERLVWPDDDVTADAVPFLERLGFDHFLRGVGPADLDRDWTLTPLGPRRVPRLDGAGIDAVIMDRTASAWLLGSAPEGPDAPHVVIAELYLRDAGRGTTTLVGIDDLPPDSRLLSALELMQRSDAPASLVPLEVGAVDRARLRLPPEDEPDLGSIGDRYAETRGRVDTYGSLVGSAGQDDTDVNDPTSTIALSDRLVASLATDLDDADRAAIIAAVDAEVGAALGGVGLVGQTDVNLTSRSGSLPVGVENRNSLAVEVSIRVRSDRLDFPEGQEFTVVAEPGETRLDVPVEARATGSVPTFVELWTPDGGLLLDERQLNVRSTAISGTGLALGAGALLVLGVWWIRSWRRHRAARDAGADDPAAIDTKKS